MPMHSPAHPGRIIKSSLDELDLSVAQAAAALGITRSQLNRVVNGTSGVSADMALRLEAVIGSTADTWLRMQAAYELAQIRNGDRNPAALLKRIPTPAAAGPDRLRPV